MDESHKPSPTETPVPTPEVSLPPEQPFTVRFGRLLAGQSREDPILDPANPNLRAGREE